MNEQKLAANALRILSADAVEAARSGHPGMPMGMADIAEVLWRRFLRHNPENPNWYNRDRFILSNGHGSMLQYACLHLSGYDLSIEDIKQFRQLHSRTPGHPEFGMTPGVETTSGPLGQGLANAVGMALAERNLADTYNKSGFKIVDHYTYCFLGDGCLMEGISHEACSLAGTWQLGKLIAFWDDNGISIDGDVQGWFTDDTPARFRAYGWHVIDSVDGHDAQAIAAAIERAQNEVNLPTLICCKTTIGHGAPNMRDTCAVHGNPLGADELEACRKELDWPHKSFHVPEDIYKLWCARNRGKNLQREWDMLMQRYQESHPGEALEFKRRMQRELPEDFQKTSELLQQKTLEQAADIATRKASKQCLAAFSPIMPELIGGSADVTDSVNTRLPNEKAITARDASGNTIYFGVREFAMAAIANGLSLHGGCRPFIGNYLVFSDYARSAIRMAALMQQPIVYILSHDSLGLGEDGPTHQPIEHIASLRLIPNLAVWRPADGLETTVAWQSALERTDGPTALVLSRQTLAALPHDEAQLADIAQGGYTVLPSAPEGESAEILLIATGSEVALAVSVAELCANKKINCRVVSLPCVEQFLNCDEEFCDAVLGDEPHCYVIEAGVTAFWQGWTRGHGEVIGIDDFGVSAPGDVAMQYAGFDAEKISEFICAQHHDHDQ